MRIPALLGGERDALALEVDFVPIPSRKEPEQEESKQAEGQWIRDACGFWKQSDDSAGSQR